MSKTIDEKVVSLEFDNSKFEKNVKESMSTLDKLKAKLNFKGAAKGLEEIEKASKSIDFSPVSKHLDEITSKFSPLEIAGRTAISNLTNKVVDFGLQLAKTMSGFDLVKSGWSKMDQMTASVQTLVNSTGLSVEEITRHLNKLMIFSDETSFGFNDMTSALATMTSSGGDINKLIPMIEGIANATAYAGKGAAEFSRVIYNLNQSYSNGFLNSLDWKSVALAGVNTKALMETLIQVGVEMGTIAEGEVDVNNFVNSLKDQWATTEVMEESFYRFAAMTEAAQELYDAGEVETFSEAYELLSGQFSEMAERAAKSGQEAKTFKESIDSIVDAASSKWMNIFVKMFGNYDQAKRTWTALANDLYGIFVSPIEKFSTGIITPAFESSWKQLKDIIDESDAGIKVLDKDLIDFIKDYGDWTGDLSDDAWAEHVDKLLKDYGGLEELLASGEIRSNDMVGKFFDQLLNNIDSIDTASSKLEKAQKLFDEIWAGDWGDGEARIKALTEAGYDYSEVQGMIDDIAKHKGGRSGYKLLEEDIANLSDEMLLNIGYTEEQIEALNELKKQAEKTGTPLNKLLGSMQKKSGRQLLAESISNITTTIINLKKTIGESWSRVFNPAGTASALYGVVDWFNRLTTKIRELTTESKLLQSIFTTIFSVFRILTSTIGQLVRGGFSILQRVFEKLNIDIGDFSETVGNSLESFANWIVENDSIFNLLDNVGEKVEKLIGIVQDWIDAFMNISYVKGIIDGFKQSISDLKTEISNIGTEGITIEGIKNTFEGFIDSIKNDSVDPIQAFSTAIGGYFGTIGSKAIEAKDKVVNAFNNIDFDKTKEDGQKLAAFLGNLLETLAGFGAGYMVLKGFQKLADGFATLMTPLKTLNTVINSFAGVGTALTGYINALKNNQTTNNILKMAIAVGILAAALYVMAKLDWKALLLVIGAVMALAVVLGVLAWAFSRIGAINEGAEKFSKIVLMLAASVLVLAFAMKVMDSVKDIEGTLWATVTLLGVLTGAILLLSHKAGKATVGIKMILGMSIALYILGKAMVQLSTMSWPQIWTGLGALLGLIGLLYLVSLALSKMPNSWQAAANLLIFAISMHILLKAIKALAEEDPEVLYRGLIAMIPLFGAFALVMLSVKAAGAASATAAGYFLGISISLMLMQKAVKAFGEMDMSTLVKGTIIAGLLMGLMTKLGAFAGLVARLSGNLRQMVGMGLMMVAMAAALYLMAGVVLIFKNIKPEDLYKSVGAIAALEIAFGAMVWLMKSTQFDAWSFKAFSGLVAVIAVLAASVFALSFIPWEKLAVATGSMVILMGMLGLLMQSMRFITKENTTSIIIGMAGMILILGTISGILYVLSKNENSDRYLDIAKSLIEIIGSLSVLMLALSYAGKIASAPGVALGALKILGAIGIFATILGAIGYLGANIISEEAMNKAIGFITKAGELIGSFFGGIFGGLASGTMNTIIEHLPGTAKALTNFSDGIIPFLSLSTPEKFSDTLKDISEMIRTFGNPIFLDSIKKIVGNSGNIETLKDFFTEYGDIIITFSDKVKDSIDSDAINAAANAGLMMANIYDSLPKEGSSVAKWLFGEKKTLSKFGVEMGSFADSLVGVSEKLSGDSFKESAISQAKKMGELMASLYDAIPKQGSTLDKWLSGEKSLESFGNDIEKFASAMIRASYILVKNPIDQSAVENAKTAGETFAALSESIPETGSLHSLLFGGNKDLSNFGNQIQNFAAGLVSMCTLMADASISPYYIWKAEEMGKAMVRLADQLAPATGAFEGETSLASFGYELSLFGQGVKGLIEAIQDLSPEKIVFIAAMLQSLLGLEELRQQLVLGIETTAVDIQELLNTTITEIGEECKTLLTEIMDEIIEIMNKSEEAEEAGRMTMQGLLDGLTNADYLIAISEAGSAAGSAFMSAFRAKTGINSPSKVMYENGEYVMEGLILGLESKMDSVSNTGSIVSGSLMDSIFNGFSDINSVFDDLSNPVITPVLDLTNINDGFNDISKYFGMEETLAASLGVDPHSYNQNGEQVVAPEINVNFTVNQAGGDITDADIETWSYKIANMVNVELGKLIS